MYIIAHWSFRDSAAGLIFSKIRFYHSLLFFFYIYPRIQPCGLYTMAVDQPGAKFVFVLIKNFPGGSDVKASSYNAGDLGSIPGWGRASGVGNGKPLQYSCLEYPMDRGAW